MLKRRSNVICNVNLSAVLVTIVVPCKMSVDMCPAAYQKRSLPCSGTGLIVHVVLYFLALPSVHLCLVLICLLLYTFSKYHSSIEYCFCTVYMYMYF